MTAFMPIIIQITEFRRELDIQKVPLMDGSNSQFAEEYDTISNELQFFYEKIPESASI